MKISQRMECSADELLELAEGYSIKKILTLGKEQLAALMEEMRELYVLQNTSEGRYRLRDTASAR